MSEQPVLLSQLSARELVARLDKEYPHKCVARGESIEDANRYAGTRELIDELVNAIEEEDEEAAAAAQAAA
jgi:hypothetical protein